MQFVHLKKTQFDDLINSFECYTLNDKPLETKKENRIKTKLNTYEQIKNKLNFEILDNELYYNDNYYNRLYFDIDEIEDNMKLKEIFFRLQQFINTFVTRDYHLCITGYIRDTSENIKSFIDKDDLEDNWLYIIQRKDPVKDEDIKQKHIKKYSFHIVLLDVLFKTDDLFKIFNYIDQTDLKDRLGFIDKSVYKTKKESQQLLRLSLSDKSNNGEIKSNTHIDVNRFEKNKIDLNYLLFYSSVGIFNKNEQTDKYLNYDLSELKIQIKQEIQINNQVKQININQRRDQTDKTEENNSIFQYIRQDDKIVNIKDLYEDRNHFKFSNLLFGFIPCVLTPEEIIYEIKKLDLPEIKEFNKSVDEWLNEVSKDLKKKVYQDITNIKSLYTLKSYINKYYEQELNKQEKKDKNEYKEYNKQLYKTLKPHLNNINYYIEKYEKLNFVSHEFYNVFESNEDKKDKLLYNCFKNLDGLIYNCFSDEQFKNITQFRNKYKLNSNKANEIYELLITFDNIKEYKRLKTEYTVKNLSNEQLKQYNDNIQKFLDILKTSFYDVEDDFNYYLSFYAMKLQSNKTINKGLINQGTMTDPAINSFKTLFNELLDNYITIKSADVNNVNKSLNGSYFMGDLLVVEELPKKVKDVDNLINVFRAYSSKKILTVEEKGEKPKEILNKCDYIINTNHTVKDMFKDYNDAKGLLKRFRIITRKSIKMDDETTNLIEELKQHNDIYQYLLKEHLINKITNKYFIEHKDKYNDIMDLYLKSSSPKTTMNKKSTNESKDEYIARFKENFLDTQHRLKLNKFREDLIKDKVLTLEHAKTLKQYLIMLLSESDVINKTKEDEKLIKLDIVDKTKEDEKLTEANVKHIKILQDKAIEIIYDTYYEYDEDNTDEDKTNEKK